MAIVDIIEDVYKAWRKVNTKRSVSIQIVNHTDVSFTKAGDYSAHGHIEVDPPDVIDPHSKASFSAVSDDWSVMTGVEGWVKYQAELDPVKSVFLRIDWDNPFVGHNTCSAEISPSPTRFRATAHCSSGNDASDRIEIWQSDWLRYVGCGNDIGVGANGALWLVGCSLTAGGYVIRHSSVDSVASKVDIAAWKPASGGGVRIAVGPDGTPWLVNSEGSIYRGDPDGGAWTQVDGCGKDIAVGPDGTVWLVGCSQTSGGYVIRYRKHADSSWRKASGGGIRITVGLDGRPWLVNIEGSIYHGNLNGSDWGKPKNGCANDIGVGANGAGRVPSLL